MKLSIIINSLNIGGAEKLVADSFPLIKEKIEETQLIVLKNSPSFIAKQLDQKGKHVKFLYKGSLYNPFLIFKLIPILRKSEVVHFHLFPTLYWVVIASMFVRNKPKLIYTEHSTHNKRRDSKIFKFLDRLVYKRIDKIVSISKDVDTNIKDHLGQTFESKVSLIHNGVDLQTITSATAYHKSDLGFENPDILLLQVSSFRWQKDQATLIKALKSLPSDYKLLLAGDGPLREEMENLVKELELTGRVQFLGNRPDIPNLLKTADIIVLSSKHEGLSLASIEGMASGKPFIGSDVPGLSEIVKDYGVLFPRGNSQQLAEKIEKLRNDKSYSGEVVEKCLARASQFDLSIMIDKHIDLYRSLIRKTS
ncbi:glycosyltransferase [Chryseobacterium koreense]|uniref:glycosyltransferase n=1 Tax=Chryseobacterium koreense TaxID=232216 RepID=UPI0026F096BC|nr:glycosyltransferase [Chryseobacterium koreense]